MYTYMSIFILQLFFVFIGDSNNTPTFLIPLTIVFLITLTRNVYENYERKKNDIQENHRTVEYLSNDENKTVKETYWKNLKPGDIIKIYSSDIIPADVLLLKCSDSSGMSYIETLQLDGETNLKHKKSIPIIQETINSERELCLLKVQVLYEPPSSDLHNFRGKLRVYGDKNRFKTMREKEWKRMHYEKSDEEIKKSDEFPDLEERNETYIEYDLNIDNFLYRSSIVKNTNYIYGLVIYTGKYTKIFQNILIKNCKISTLESYYNKHFLFLAFLQVALCIMASIFYSVNIYTVLDKHWYVHIQIKQSAAELMMVLLTSFGKFMLLLSYFIPLTTILLLEISRNVQAKNMNNDIYMHFDNERREKKRKRKSRWTTASVEAIENATRSTEVTEFSNAGRKSSKEDTSDTLFKNKTMHCSGHDDDDADESSPKININETNNCSKQLELNDEKIIKNMLPYPVNKFSSIHASVSESYCSYSFPKKHHSFPPTHSMQNVFFVQEAVDTKREHTSDRRESNKNTEEDGIKNDANSNESESNGANKEKNITSINYVKYHGERMNTNRFNKQNIGNYKRNCHNFDNRHDILKKYKIENWEKKIVDDSLYSKSLFFTKTHFQKPRTLFLRRKICSADIKIERRNQRERIKKMKKKWVNVNSLNSKQTILVENGNIINSSCGERLKDVGDVTNTEDAFNTSEELQNSSIKGTAGIAESEKSKVNNFKEEMDDVKNKRTTNISVAETDRATNNKKRIANVEINFLHKKENGDEQMQTAEAKKLRKECIKLEEAHRPVSNKNERQIINHICQSKNMIEELGCVTHLFTDKTGTLTNNKLHFECVAIYNKLFGLNKNKRRKEGKGKFNPLRFLFHLEVSNRKFRKNAREFFFCLSLCHSVLIRKKENSLNTEKMEYVNFFAKSDQKGTTESVEYEQEMERKEEEEKTKKKCVNDLTNVIHVKNSKYITYAETYSSTELNKYFNNIFKLYEQHEHLNADLKLMQKIYDYRFLEQMKTYVKLYRDKKITLPVVVLCKKTKTQLRVDAIKNKWRRNNTKNNNSHNAKKDTHCSMYDVSSPDESALLQAANILGIKFIGRSNIHSIDIALTNKTLVNLLLSDTDKMYLNDLMCYIGNLLKKEQSNDFEENENGEIGENISNSKQVSNSSNIIFCENVRAKQQKKNINIRLEKGEKRTIYNECEQYSNVFSKVKLNFKKKEIHPEELKITAFKKYEILIHINVDVVDIFPFNHIQKYMYVVVKERHENLLKFYVKGADEAIYKIAKNNKAKKKISNYLQRIAIQGYRTLVFSYIPIEEKIYCKLKKKYKRKTSKHRGSIGFYLEDLNIFINKNIGADVKKSVKHLSDSDSYTRDKKPNRNDINKYGSDKCLVKTEKTKRNTNKRKTLLEVAEKKRGVFPLNVRVIADRKKKSNLTNEKKKSNHLRVIGCTGIHDQLQKNVKTTIKQIKDANIKICMLTGDKIETAISVAYNSNILNSNTYNHIINSNNSNTILNQLFQFFTYLYASDVAKNKISYYNENKKNKKITKTIDGSKNKNEEKTYSEKNGNLMEDKKNYHKKEKNEEGVNMDFIDLEKSGKRQRSMTKSEISYAKYQKELKAKKKINTISKKKKKKKKKMRPTFTLYKFLNIIAFKTNKKNEYAKGSLSYFELKNIVQQYLDEQIVEKENLNFHHMIEKKKLEVYQNSCLTITGECVDIINQNKRLKNLFLSVIKFVDYVIIGRCTPKNKSDVVQFFNSLNSRNVTLAIGDGSNDVSMLVKANIGVAIYNKENTQATKAADFVISEFQHLQYLLLCHGGEALRKNSILVYHTICKNIIFGSVDLFFAFLSNFSGTDIFNPYLKQLFNLFFTTFPILTFVFYDLQLPYHVLLSTPQLYTTNSAIRANRYMSQKLLMLVVFYGIYVSFLVTFLTTYALANVPIYNNFLVFLNLYGHIVYFVIIIVVNLMVVLVSTVFSKLLILFVFLSIFLFLCMTYMCQLIDGCKELVPFIRLFKMPVFHYYLFAVIFLNLFPLICYKMYKILIRPKIPQIIRERIYKGVFDIVLVPQNMSKTKKGTYLNFLERNEKNDLKTRGNKKRKCAQSEDAATINEKLNLAVIVPKCARHYTGYAFAENDKNRWRYLHVQESSNY